MSLPYNLLIAHTHAASQIPRRRGAGRSPRYCSPPYGRVSRRTVCNESKHAYSPVLGSRVTITDYRGNIIFDSFVRPTWVSELPDWNPTHSDRCFAIANPSAISAPRRRG